MNQTPNLEQFPALHKILFSNQTPSLVWEETIQLSNHWPASEQRLSSLSAIKGLHPHQTQGLKQRLSPFWLLTKEFPAIKRLVRLGIERERERDRYYPTLKPLVWILKERLSRFQLYTRDYPAMKRLVCYLWSRERKTIQLPSDIYAVERIYPAVQRLVRSGQELAINAK